MEDSPLCMIVRIDCAWRGFSVIYNSLLNN